jgi:hypothetical protein
MGRPSIFSDDYAEDICEHLTKGGSMASWCEQPNRPSYGTVFRWLSERDEFRAAYTRAREVQAHNDADKIEDVRQQVRDGSLAPDAARVIIDSLKWTAGRRAPKVYGDKLTLDGQVDVSYGARLAAARDKLPAIEDGSDVD